MLQSMVVDDTPTLACATEVENLLNVFLLRLVDRTGLTFRRERWPDLLRSLQQMAQQQSYSDALPFLCDLLEQPWDEQCVQSLVACLTVGETYFFRDPRCLTFIEEQILTPLINYRHQRGDPFLRVWSAGCCSGEEPYSIAILLRRLLPDIERWSVSLMATDINQIFLQQAARGVYSSWSMRDTPASTRNQFFTSVNRNAYAIENRIKQMVTFSALNLAVDRFPDPHHRIAEMDLIICRNVLMYLDDDVVARVVNSFYDTLAYSGWLVVSACEASPAVFHRFEAVQTEYGIFYRKNFAGNARAVSSTNISSDTMAISRESAYVITLATPELNARDTQNRNITPFSFGEGELDFRASREKTDVAEVMIGTDLSAANQKAVELQQQIEQTLSNARHHADTAQTALAQACCYKVLALDRSNATAHFILAMLAYENQQYDEAVAHLQRALYLQPEFLIAHFWLAQCFRKIGRDVSADRHLNNALRSLHSWPAQAFPPESGQLNAEMLRELITSLLTKSAKR